MAIPKPVSDIADVKANIAAYSDAAAAGRLQSMIAYVRHWYAVTSEDGKWIFAPSKFIGYAGITPRLYEKEHDELDGRATETALKEWFEELDPGHPLEAILRKELRRFVAEHGKSLNQLARIHVLKDETSKARHRSKAAGGEKWRITSDAGVLGGKPCIRGMRIRVADILEMLAHGAERSDILDDFPYLEDGDITAALEYAMGTVDHRLIRAA